MIGEQSLGTAAETRRRPASLAVHFWVQHVLLIASLIMLAATGLPQRFDSLGPSEWLIDGAGGLENLRTVHHAAGAVLLAVVAYHIAAVAAMIFANRDFTPLTMLPDLRDYRDGLLTFVYLIGLRQERPTRRTGPAYFEKFDYWVLAWGTLIMGLTGLIRLFPARASGLLSVDTVSAALSGHSDIGPLLAIWLVVIHLVYVKAIGLSRAASAAGPPPPGVTSPENGDREA